MSYTRPGYYFPCRPALRPNSLLNSGGEGWIRTNVGVSQQIYSLPPLATRAPLRRELAIMGPSGHPVKRCLVKSQDFEHRCSHPYTARCLRTPTSLREQFSTRSALEAPQIDPQRHGIYRAMWRRALGTERRTDDTIAFLHPRRRAAVDGASSCAGPGRRTNS